MSVSISIKLLFKLSVNVLFVSFINLYIFDFFNAFYSLDFWLQFHLSMFLLFFLFFIFNYFLNIKKFYIKNISIVIIILFIFYFSFFFGGSIFCENVEKVKIKHFSLVTNCFDEFIIVSQGAHNCEYIYGSNYNFKKELKELHLIFYNTEALNSMLKHFIIDEYHHLIPSRLTIEWGHFGRFVGPDIELNDIFDSFYRKLYEIVRRRLLAKGVDIPDYDNRGDIAFKI
jgi:hypothetical protein